MKTYNLLFRNVSKLSQQDIIKDLEHTIGYPIKLNAEHIYTISLENELEIFYYDRVKYSAVKISNPFDIRRDFYSDLDSSKKILYIDNPNNIKYNTEFFKIYDEVHVLGFDIPPELKKINNIILISLIDYVNITIKNHLLKGE